MQRASVFKSRRGVHNTCCQSLGATTRVVRSGSASAAASAHPARQSVAAALSSQSSFAPSRRGVSSSVVVARAGAGAAAPCVLQFVRGVDEICVPDVKLTRSRDGSNGVATFTFVKPTIFENDADIVSKGEITGLYMIDEEGELQTTDVLASFLDGKPNKIEATYVMKSAFQWDRFMRFMERYADANGLGFNKA